MSAAQSSFRGIKGIRDIKAELQPLAEWYLKFKPEVDTLTCSRIDYDLIARWPRAANVEGFDVTDNGIFFKGLRLSYDTGEGRYVKPAAPDQQVIS
jgi:hypothetical protein